VAFSPDGKAVLTGSVDNTARLWSAASGKELTPPLRHQGQVTAVAFSPDGKAVVTGSQDTARLWRMPVVFKGDARRIKLRTQVLTGTAMDDHGDLQVLDTNTWKLRRQQLMQLGESPIPQEDVLGWHRREAIEAEIAGQWYARAWHLSRLIAAAPNDTQLWKDRAQAHVHLEQWEKAALDFREAFQLDRQDLQVGCYHALLRLSLSDDKGYRQTCATLLERWGSAKDPLTLRWVAWTCALAPDAVADLRLVVRLAEKALRAEGEEILRRSRSLTDRDKRLQVVLARKAVASPTILGAILYRAGRCEEAVKCLQVATSPTTGSSWPWPGRSWLFLAMARQKLGQTDEAKRCLARARELMKAPSILPRARLSSWGQRRHVELQILRLELQILHREAEAMLKGTRR
jgi:tetratricopeptide (TPR) repeat protein